MDENSVPTGELMPVENTPFDFLQPKAIGCDIDADHIQIKHGGGYDHNFVIDGGEGQLNPCAHVYEPTSGREMEVLTTQPGVQLYTGNFLDGSLAGKHGKVYQHRGAFCLETQHFPDSPNQPTFPTTILEPGQTYQHETHHRFSVK